jgi:hypothetical protein
MGLKTTNSVAFFQNEFDSRHSGCRLRHSPFRKSGLVYPFILVESKSEENSPGFEAIQRQSAFPLREFLRLQQKLQQTSGQPLDPLVWFFSYQADEWRLSAAVVNDGKYQVYDLWINRLLDPSGSLQLLLLVDFIADWARDIYRLNILGCLGGGTDRVKNFRESSTDTYASQRSMGTVLRTDPQPPVQLLPEPDIIPIFPSVQVATALDDTQSLAAPLRSNLVDYPTHPFLRWTGQSTILSRPARDMTIRHANMVEFRFLHLRMPDDIQALSTLLHPIMNKGVQHVRNFWEAVKSILLDPLCGISTTLSWIDQVRCLWLRVRPIADDVADANVQAFFRFRTYLQGSDWQLVREMTCISWTSGGIAALAHLSGDNSPLSGAYFLLDAEECASKKATATITRLGLLTGKWSAAAAFASRTLYLDRTVSNWTDREAARGEDRLFEALILPHMQNIEKYVDADIATLAVIPKRIPPAFTRSLGLQNPLTPTAKAVLLHCQSDNDPQTPRWCLMVVEEVDFMVDRAVGEMVTCAVGHDEALVFNRHQSGILSWIKNAPLASLGDKRCIQWWSDHLL